jgi:trehalose synthase
MDATRGRHPRAAHGGQEVFESLFECAEERSLIRRLGERAKESVRQRFLMTRLMEDWLDLVASFETRFRLEGTREP